MRRWRHVFAVPILLIAALFIAACGGGGDNAGPDDDDDAPTATPTTAKPTPDELGDRIYADYVAMFEEVDRALEGNPPAATARPKLTAIKSTYIEKFVALGRLREVMPESDQPKVDAAVVRLLSTKPIDPALYQRYSAAVTRLNTEDIEVGRVAASLNILTQYAFFDLLKKQEPDEAKRLGIE